MNTIANMETIYHNLADMNLSKKNRAALADMLRASFINGFHEGLSLPQTDKDNGMMICMENEAAQHVIFLRNEASK